MAIKKVKRIIHGKPEWVFIFDIYDGEGRRIRTPRNSYFPTRLECETAVNAIKTDIRRGIYNFGGEKKPAIKISELREKWTASLTSSNRTKGYLKKAERTLKTFQEAVGDKAIIDLETEDLAKYAQFELKHGNKRKIKNNGQVEFISLGKGEGTVKQEVTMVHVALNAASSLFRELKDYHSPKKPRLGLPDSARERIITYEEEEKIIAAYMTKRARENIYYKLTREQGARIFWFALRTAMRVGEIIGLRRSSVVFAVSPTMPDGYVLVQEQSSGRRTKTGKSRKIPLTPSSVALLKEQLATHDNEYVFPSKINAKEPIKQFYSGFKAACVVAQVLYGRATPGGLVFHDTRHTAITRMLENGMPLHVVAKIAGHSNESMTMRYAHVADGTMHKAMMSVDNSAFPSP